MLVLVRAQCTLTSSCTLNKLVLVQAASWCAVRGRERLGMLLPESQPASEGQSSFSMPEQEHVAVCICKTVFACLRVCLKIMFNFFLIILVKLYVLPFIFWFACSVWHEGKKSSIIQDGAVTDFHPFILRWTHIIPLDQGFLTLALLIFWARQNLLWEAVLCIVECSAAFLASIH